MGMYELNDEMVDRLMKANFGSQEYDLCADEVRDELRKQQRPKLRTPMVLKSGGRHYYVTRHVGDRGEWFNIMASPNGHVRHQIEVSPNVRVPEEYEVVWQSEE